MKVLVPTEAMLRKMSPEDRKLFGRAGVTQAEANVKYDNRQEKLLQEQCANYCNLRSVFYIRSRMDKKTTVRKGIPDFLIVLPGGRALAIECKVLGGVVSEDQKKLFDEYWNKTGTVVHIVFNFDQFKQLIDDCLPQPL